MAPPRITPSFSPPGVDLPLFERFIGVDLGGGKGKTTALAVLAARDGRAVIEKLLPGPGMAPLFDDALLAAIRAVGPRAVLAIDAPLALPACLRCELPLCPGQALCPDPTVAAMRSLAEPGAGEHDGRRGKPLVTPYTQRLSEVYLHRLRGVLPRETLGQGMGPLTARAAHLVRALAYLYGLNKNLIAVYPKPTITLLGFEAEHRRYKKHLHERETRAGILDALSHHLSFAPGVWREECVQSDHVFDAVICAFTAYLRQRDGWRLPAAVAHLHAVVARDGWIWAPPDPADPATAETDPDATGQLDRRRTAS